MFTKNNKLISNIQNMSNYIEGYDAYNSKLLKDLDDPNIERETYIIKTFQYRPDLIASDYYGSTDYTSYVVYQSKSSLQNLTRGKVLSLIPKATLDELINNI